MLLRRNSIPGNQQSNQILIKEGEWFPLFLNFLIMEDEVVKIFLRDMPVPYFLAMISCVFAGILIFILRRWILNIKSTVTRTKEEKRKQRLIAAIRTAIGIILMPFIVLFFPEISQVLLGVEGGIPIAPISALGSGMGIDRIIDAALSYKTKKK